ncbi:YdcH family protein [Sphingomonas sp. dw_22]|uniref:YdcH family protein n=1 Tax=Sphingomonas sp. dw_22 TaxID=2721175 RepID=UPI001BD3967A|nr:YdcH family protein [Sphingomonas sp. dw_22]
MNTLIERLIAAHRVLNREIRRELARRMPDQLRLNRLKKERLAIKDRLFRYFPDAAEMRSVARLALGRARPARI